MIECHPRCCDEIAATFACVRVCVRKSQWKRQKPDWITFLSVQRRAHSPKSVSALSKVSARIFPSVANGIKRPRDTNVIFIASQAPRYFRLAYAPSSVLSVQKAFYRRNQRNRRKQQTREKRRRTEERGYRSNSLLCEILFALLPFYSHDANAR